MQQGGGRGQGPSTGTASGNNQLPTRIQCAACNRFLMPGRYSNRQLDEYRTQSRRNRGNAPTTKQPTCMNCTGMPVTELKCYQCDITKGLDEFTKAQRRNPDQARCVDCVQENLDWEPDVKVQMAEEEIREERERGGSTQGSAFSTTASLAGHGNLGSGVGTSMNSSGGQGQPQGDGVWVPTHSSSGINYGNIQNPSNSARAHRSPSISSAATSVSGGTTATGASVMWGEFQQQRRPPHRNPATTASSDNGSTKGTNPGFASIKGDWRLPTPAQREEVSRKREEKRQKEAQQNIRDEDDDGSDSEWEL